MYTVYVLKSKKDGKRYIGYTNDLKRRLKQHRLGQVKSTSNRRPLELIYKETVATKGKALKYEKYYKTAAGRRTLKKLLNQQE